MNVKVEIEYCGVCDFAKECNDLSNYVKDKVPQAEVKCKLGRRGIKKIFITALRN